MPQVVPEGVVEDVLIAGIVIVEVIKLKSVHEADSRLDFGDNEGHRFPVVP